MLKSPNLICLVAYGRILKLNLLSLYFFPFFRALLNDEDILILSVYHTTVCTHLFIMCDIIFHSLTFVYIYFARNHLFMLRKPNQ